MTDRSAFLDELRAVVGNAHVLQGAGLDEWELDWNRRARGVALAVVRPLTVEQTAAVVRACAAHRVGLVPQGGNTGLVLGGIPDGSGQQIVLSTKRMQAIRAVDVANLTLTAEAGCVLQAVQDAARANGLLFPLSLASEGSCTIGGNLASNAGGTQVIRYGNARDLCLGLECVTAEGQVWHGLSTLRKDNTGYDLRHLMIGSEGTLGIITAATLKLFPQPSTQVTAWLLLATLPDALALLQMAQRALGPALSGFEVMGANAVQLVARHFPQKTVPFVDRCTEGGTTHAAGGPWFLLLDAWTQAAQTQARADVEELIGRAIEAGHVLDAVIAQSSAQAARLWSIRETIPEAQARDGLNVKHDVAVPVSQVPAFVAETHAALAGAIEGVRFVTFGHLGDGNVHYNVQAPAGAEAERFRTDQEERIHAIVYASVMRFDGSFSAEHGVGALKTAQLSQAKPEPALRMMRAIKQALDPLGILNPGKVLG